MLIVFSSEPPLLAPRYHPHITLFPFLSTLVAGVAIPPGATDERCQSGVVDVQLVLGTYLAIIDDSDGGCGTNIRESSRLDSRGKQMGHTSLGTSTQRLSGHSSVTRNLLHV